MNCPDGAIDFDSLMRLISDGKHGIDLADFSLRLHRVVKELPLPIPLINFDEQENWDWDDVHNLIARGFLTADEVDNMIHQGLR
jgi:hypothetical protein